MDQEVCEQRIEEIDSKTELLCFMLALACIIKHIEAEFNTIFVFHELTLSIQNIHTKYSIWIDI